MSDLTDPIFKDFDEAKAYLRRFRSSGGVGLNFDTRPLWESFGQQRSSFVAGHTKFSWAGITINEGGPIKWPTLTIYWTRPLFFYLRIRKYSFAFGREKSGWWKESKTMEWE
ncbi:hypothetical protein LCGC14_1907050 [marine sediment metagenome]|uniref:Uncharacterized protein n=1 Tax=marine sediment metagenome TaxID=412755 RepID=A0A0F9ISY3_9ZZZZ